jgi:hypothetical protein
LRYSNIYKHSSQQRISSNKIFSDPPLSLVALQNLFMGMEWDISRAGDQLSRVDMKI